MKSFKKEKDWKGRGKREKRVEKEMGKRRKKKGKRGENKR